jgi:hypothetical protein
MAPPSYGGGGYAPAPYGGYGGAPPRGPPPVANGYGYAAYGPPPPARPPMDNSAW